jgi:hypothetical protein
MSATRLTLQGVANAVPAEEAMFSEIARLIVDLVPMSLFVIFVMARKQFQKWWNHGRFGCIMRILQL